MGVVRIVVFDLDGTLIDSMPAQTDAFVRVSADHGIDPMTARAHYLKTAGAPLADQFAGLVTPDVSQTSAILTMESSFWAALATERFPPFPEAEKALMQLRSAGHLIAVSSGSTQVSVDRKLAASNLSGYVDFALGSEVGLTKGSQHMREIARLTQLRYGQSPHIVAFVGDTAHDMALAQSLHIFGIACVRGSSMATDWPASAIVESLGEVPLLLASL